MLGSRIRHTSTEIFFVWMNSVKWIKYFAAYLDILSRKSVVCRSLNIGWGSTHWAMIHEPWLFEKFLVKIRNQRFAFTLMSSCFEKLNDCNNKLRCFRSFFIPRQARVITDYHQNSFHIVLTTQFYTGEKKFQSLSLCESFRIVLRSATETKRKTIARKAHSALLKFSESRLNAHCRRTKFTLHRQGWRNVLFSTSALPSRVVKRDSIWLRLIAISQWGTEVVCGPFTQNLSPLGCDDVWAKVTFAFHTCLTASQALSSKCLPVTQNINEFHNVCSWFLVWLDCFPEKFFISLKCDAIAAKYSSLRWRVNEFGGCQ